MMFTRDEIYWLQGRRRRIQIIKHIVQYTLCTINISKKGTFKCSSCASAPLSPLENVILELAKLLSTVSTQFLEQKNRDRYDTFKVHHSAIVLMLMYEDKTV